MSHSPSLTMVTTQQMSGVDKKFTDQIYRPVNGNYIRSPDEFTYPYKILYPVRNVTTFETPVVWKTPKVPSPFSESGSNPRMKARGDVTNMSTTTGGTLSLRPSLSSSSSSSLLPMRQISNDLAEQSSSSVLIKKKKNKKGCCHCCGSSVGDDVYNGQSDVSNISLRSSAKRH